LRQACVCYYCGQKTASGEIKISNSSSHSRVACMIKKTMGKTIYGSSSVEEIGKRWNIPVHDYRAILTTNHYENKKPEECSMKNFKVKKLKAPFIKVEDRPNLLK